MKTNWKNLNNSKTIALACVCVLAAAVLLVPGDLLAATATDAAGKANTYTLDGGDDLIKKIQNFLFSLPIRIVTMFGFAAGAVKAALSAQYTALCTCVGFALCIPFVPKLLDALFVSTALIP